MDSSRFLIYELGRITGFYRRAVRYYVENGLLSPPAGRGRGGFYGPEHVERLKQIRKLLDEGLRLSAIQLRLAEEPGSLGEAARREVPGSHRAAKGPSAAPAPSPEAPSLSDPSADRQGWVHYSIAPGVELHFMEQVEQESRSEVSTAVEILGRMFRKGEHSE